LVIAVRRILPPERQREYDKRVIAPAKALIAKARRQSFKLLQGGRAGMI